jgi:hypothetical protein
VSNLPCTYAFWRSWEYNHGADVKSVSGSTATSMMIFPSTPFAEVIAGTIIIVISWIMDVGRELQEEQELVV